ncbi:hypothetical protein Tco_1159917 [Tanacetum coccineum]
MIFKVDFEKAYDSVRWDYMNDVLWLFKGITLGPSLQISHLFYADDAVFMGQWSESNIDTLIRVLECFDRASGLRINMNKSKLSRIYMDSNMVDQAAAKIGCATIKTLFFYLGSTVGGGRLTLLKSVLGSIPIYHMSLFKVPKKVLRSIHGIDGKLDSTAGHHQSSIWVDIVREVHALKRLGIDLANFIRRKVGDGSETSFWVDIWKGDKAFKSLYPRIYALASCKTDSVASMLSRDLFSQSFRRAPRGGEEQSQLNALLSDIEDVQLANLSDRWIWTLEGSGKFSVALIRRLIDKHLLPDVASKTRWFRSKSTFTLGK